MYLVQCQALVAARTRASCQLTTCATMRQVAALCGGELLGGAVGSMSVSLTPSALTGGFHTADTRTAGSCMLLAQARSAAAVSGTA